ncbi:DUF6056 family protein [Pontibacter fetidus]|uniref:Uncharacterized protein n=1 Tax=Pontibacter fetidus TaxID=2700082 RepID=A0A6B2GXM6_9BACT|nr:DUF6056 family protein [Pontibacter fetidus]NDK54608.1 hypothetical protein [Pontibacter fetidus]
MPTQPQQTRFYTYTNRILIAVGLYTLLPFLILAFYSHPQADDFSFAVRDRELDYLTVFQQYYNYWTGRYFSTITLFRINPMIWGSLSVYRLSSILLLILFSGSIYFILSTITQKTLSKTGLTSLAALLFALYLLQLPNPSEGFYFFSTYATYQLPNIMLLVMLAIVYKFFQARNSWVKQVYIGLAAIGSAAIVGSNEMALVIAFTTVAFITIVNLKNPEARPYLLFLFVVCMVCCFIAVMAPGNYNRMNEHPNGGKLIWSVVYAGFMTGLSFYRWLLPILAASIVYIYCFGLPLADKVKHNRLFQVDIRLVLLYFLVTIFLMNFVFAWSTGERPTPRLENVIYFFFLFGWFYGLQVAITKYKTFFSATTISPVPAAFALLIFLLSIVQIDNNISTAYVDLASGKAAAYDKALNQRYTLLRNSDCAECIVAPLPAIPKSIYFADIVSRSEKPENGIDMTWINKGVAAYFGKSEVYLAAPNPPVQDNLTTLRQAGKSTLKKESVIK